MSNPSPNPAARFYQGDQGRGYHDTKRALRAEALPWVIALRASKFQRYVEPTDIVLELGVGAGWNLAGLGCARRIGCDATEFLAERLTPLHIEFVPDIRTVPDGTAHVAICHHTLEHLLDPVEALRQLERVLKPDGKLVLHTPWERERGYARYRPDEPNHHLFNWNAQNLGNLVALLGYRIEGLGCRRYGYDRLAANMAIRCRVGETGFRLLRVCLIALRPLLEVELIARRALSAVQGGSAFTS